eukprot:363051-Chlamydomonas_euryale.AAC.6
MDKWVDWHGHSMSMRAQGAVVASGPYAVHTLSSGLPCYTAPPPTVPICTALSAVCSDRSACLCRLLRLFATPNVPAHPQHPTCLPIRNTQRACPSATPNVPAHLQHPVRTWRSKCLGCHCYSPPQQPARLHAEAVVWLRGKLHVWMHAQVNAAMHSYAPPHGRAARMGSQRGLPHMRTAARPRG